MALARPRAAARRRRASRRPARRARIASARVLGLVAMCTVLLRRGHRRRPGRLVLAQPARHQPHGRLSAVALDARLRPRRFASLRTSTQRTASGCRSRRSRCPCATRSSRPKISNFYQHHGVDFGGILRAAHRRLAARAVSGRIDDHAAARPARCSSPTRSRYAREDPGSAAGDRDRALLHQRRNPRALPQHHLLRFRRVRHRGGGAHLLRNRRRAPDDRAGRDARRFAGRAVGLLAVRESRARERTAGARARAHGRERLHHASSDGCGARRTARA